MLNRICSGCQSGVDIFSLIAAKEYGIPTGGWISLGCMTENGPKPEYKELYGIQETNDKSYSSRTFKNVETSDGTLRFAVDFNSPGELCTLKAIWKYKKPYFDINVRNYLDTKIYENYEVFIDKIKINLTDVFQWINENNIKILNVAGNKESTFIGIGEFVYAFLLELFKLTNPKMIESKIIKKDFGYKHPWKR